MSTAYGPPRHPQGGPAADICHFGASRYMPLRTTVPKYLAHNWRLFIALSRLSCPNAAFLLTDSALEMQTLRGA